SRPALDPAEDHPARRRLEHAGDRQVDLMTDGRTPLLHDQHRAIVEVANPLADLVPGLDDAHAQRLAWESHRLHRVGQLIEVNDFDSLQLSNLVEVEVIGHHAGAHGLGENDQALIDLVYVAQFLQVGLVHLKFNFGVVLHPLENVQPTPPAVALQLVGTVGDALQLLEDRARHDQLVVDDPRITDIGNPAVDNDA